MSESRRKKLRNIIKLNPQQKNIDHIVNKQPSSVDLEPSTKTQPIAKSIYAFDTPKISGYDEVKNQHWYNQMLLRHAYENTDGSLNKDPLFAVAGNKMALAGSQPMLTTKQGDQDWFDNFTKVPWWGDLKRSDRYSQLTEAMKHNPNVKSLVGHSLSGSVILEKQQSHPEKDLTTVTYNSPILQTNTDQGDRYRTVGDIVSSLDSGARSGQGWDIDPLSAHNIETSQRNKYGFASNTITKTGEEILIE